MNYIKTFEELHYADTFQGEFSQFKKEYNKYKSDGYYYVQFTDHKNDVLDRTTYSDPDHSDPSGNYGYPLKYIIDHPADVWYGHNTKYLRVLKANPSNNTLWLNEIRSEDDCVNMLWKLFRYRPSEARTAITNVKKVFKNRLELKKGGQWGRITFQILQVDALSDDLDSKNPQLRTGPEQSAILLKAGFDAFGDASKKDTTAVINSREPEQICFLNRKSFTVDKIYTLIHTKKGKTMTVLSPEETPIGQKVAVELFSYMDDHISGRNSKHSSTATLYSKKGRSIKISYTKNDSYYKDKNMGQKIHKADKLSDDNRIHVTVATEKGDFEYSSASDETMEEVLRKLKPMWDEIKDSQTVEGWIPRSDKQALLEEENEKKRYYTEQARLRKEKQLGELQSWKTKYLRWCDYLGIDFSFGNDDNAYKLYDEYFINAVNIIKNNPVSGIEFIKSRGGRIFNIDNPDFDKNILKEFKDSLVAIMEKIISIDKIFIEYNFNNYLDKKQ